MDFKKKELFIFDFDGTLIDSIPDLTQAINSVLSHYGMKPLTIVEVAPFVGNGAKKLVERALKHALQPKEVTDKLFNEAFKLFFSAYRKDVCVKTYLYPGVLETLQYLDNKGYEMTICTNKPMEFIEPILEKLSIKQYFTFWIGGDSLLQKKPDGAPLLYLVEKMNKNVDKCIMVGDSKNDILAAINAGMESIGVSYGYNYNEHIAVYNPTKVVDNFDELQELF
ncbi:MAG: phosphoglycolate phosphatase [Dysgonamonadaceae bacterium]|nr:phosphoglycolate phosphatase [Dysgonamonadaceae bacterium]